MTLAKSVYAEYIWGHIYIGTHLHIFQMQKYGTNERTSIVCVSACLWPCVFVYACWFLRYFPNLNFMCGIFFMQTNQWKMCRAWVELKTLCISEKFSCIGFFAFLSHFFSVLLNACFASFFHFPLISCSLFLRVYLCMYHTMSIYVCVCVLAFFHRLSVWLSFSFYSLLRVWYTQRTCVFRFVVGVDNIFGIKSLYILFCGCKRLGTMEEETLTVCFTQQQKKLQFIFRNRLCAHTKLHAPKTFYVPKHIQCVYWEKRENEIEKEKSNTHSHTNAHIWVEKNDRTKCEREKEDENARDRKTITQSFTWLCIKPNRTHFST